MPPPRTAWNLLYETADAASWMLPVEALDPGTRVEAAAARPTEQPSGWIGQHGPAIAPETWPRSPGTGLPMRHTLTLWLPPEYLTRGPALPGIAIFQGDTADGGPVEQDAAPGSAMAGPAGRPADDPHLASLAAARPHPRLTTAVTTFAPHRFALIWLTADELAPGPTAPPRDIRRPAEHTTSPNAWDDPQPTRRVWLQRREDRNVGLATRSPDYRGPYDERSGDLMPWARSIPFEFANHLGGTYMEIDFTPSLSPRFLQLGRSVGIHFDLSYAASGILAVDLESAEFDLMG
ncbi:hypothetical protein OCAE111667_17510 [Occultella aeris]|uniref:Uncharacterized protein n=2 Tax=Occultella aeris TaxID=2761496 RepID=A0A7M4DHL1_9MICO|nr:hypothetical protein HALOF300_01609 [Occultella aeris]